MDEIVFDFDLINNVMERCNKLSIARDSRPLWSRRQPRTCFVFAHFHLIESEGELVHRDGVCWSNRMCRPLDTHTHSHILVLSNFWFFSVATLRSITTIIIRKKFHTRTVNRLSFVSIESNLCIDSSVSFSESTRNRKERSKRFYRDGTSKSR